MRETSVTIAALAASAIVATGPAVADGILGSLEGSFGEGGFEDRYVPPVTMPTLNESPFITTEARPIYIYHKIPNDFLTGGGSVHAYALQARMALTDRLAFIATTDGYADLNFDAGLPNTNGFLDITAGLKYAVISDPAAGEIVTLGARYTAPTGNVDIESAGIGLTGEGNGCVDLFVSGAKTYDDFQLQGSIGAQIGLAEESWSYVHAHGHANIELFENFFPLFEANMILPFDGGDRIAGSTLTGTDVFDFGASDPDMVFTVGIGARYRVLDNVIFGTAVSNNIIDTENTGVHGMRVTTDLTLHF